MHIGIIILFGILLLVGALSFAASLRWRKLSERQTRVLLSGGGTGGHVNPALAIAEAIRSREPEVRFLYVGVRNKAEAVIVGKVGYRLRFVCSEGFPGLRPSLRLARFLLRLGIGVAQSLVLLTIFAPKWIVATGGYVSAPVIAAALVLKKLRIAPVRIFLHEQNSIPGQLNALMGKWVDRVLLTFPQTLSFFPKNGVVVGYPIRHSIVPAPFEEAREKLSFALPPGRQVVFAFGGSQGARTINRAMVDALRYLIPYRDRIFVIHGTGLASAGEYAAASDTLARIDLALSPEEKGLLGEFYYRQDYFHNIADIYSVSSLIVCRSGAGSLNEISRIGKPALLIPKANLPGDHQVMNARAMKNAGAAEVLYEDTIMEEGRLLEKLEGKVLAEKVISLLDSPDRLREMAERSTQFLRRKSIERILSEIYGDTPFPDGNGCQPIPFRGLIGNTRLLQILGTALAREGRNFDPLAVVGDADDLDYYRHRAAGLLSHKPWQDRNLGVKLIGLTRHRDKIPTLLEMLSDRTPVNRIRKMFGGDFEQVGFIRRNIVQALPVLDHCDREVERHLLLALEDPYFEVRSQTCRTAACFGSRLEQAETWLVALLGLLSDRCFEVVSEAALALGEIGRDFRAAGALLSLRESHYWQVRDAALRALRRLVDRGVVEPSAELLSQMSSFILTSTDFKPHFAIKQTYTAVQDRCVSQRDPARPNRGAPSFTDQVARKS